MVFLRFSPVKGGCGEESVHSKAAAGGEKGSEKARLTAPVSMSYISAPRLHQSTARLCPLLIRISGALKHVTEWLRAKVRRRG